MDDSFHPYGENQEPYWRSHDAFPVIRAESLHEEPAPPCRLGPMGDDPDWDDSRWEAGERFWLGHRYHRSGPWAAFKHFVGIGPEESGRPDWRIYEEVCEALAQEPEVDASEIEVSVDNGVVNLQGHVPDHWMKRQAEDAIYFLPGVRSVRNRLVLAGPSVMLPERFF